MSKVNVDKICSSLTPLQLTQLLEALELRKMRQESSAEGAVKKAPLRALHDSVDAVSQPALKPATKTQTLKSKVELYQSLFSSDEEIGAAVKTAESSLMAKPMVKPLSPKYLKAKARAQTQRTEIERIGRRILYTLNGHSPKPALTKFERSILEEVRQALALIDVALIQKGT